MKSADLAHCIKVLTCYLSTQDSSGQLVSLVCQQLFQQLMLYCTAVPLNQNSCNFFCKKIVIFNNFYSLNDFFAFQFSKLFISTTKKSIDTILYLKSDNIYRYTRD